MKNIVSDLILNKQIRKNHKNKNEQCYQNEQMKISWQGGREIFESKSK